MYFFSFYIYFENKISWRNVDCYNYKKKANVYQDLHYSFYIFSEGSNCIEGVVSLNPTPVKSHSSRRRRSSSSSNSSNSSSNESLSSSSSGSTNCSTAASGNLLKNFEHSETSLLHSSESDISQVGDLTHHCNVYKKKSIGGKVNITLGLYNWFKNLVSPVTLIFIKIFIFYVI